MTWHRCPWSPELGTKEARAAVAPRHTTIFGAHDLNLDQGPGLHVATSRASGFLCSRILLRRSHLKFFTRIRHIQSVSTQAGLGRSSVGTTPVGPANGFPSMSSRSPSCSLTNVTAAKLRHPIRCLGYIGPLT